jgi:hypothetical protein
MRWKLTVLMLMLAVIVGCGENPLTQGKKRRGPAMQLGGQLAPADQPDLSPPPPPPPAKNQPRQETSSESVPPPPPPPPPPAEPDRGVVREAAKAGVTGKGQYAPGPITTPIAVYFSVRERAVFDIQVASAMNVYKGEHGYFPKTQEEFMDKIINANSIHLPELRPGYRYVYDPEKAAKMSNYDPHDPPLMVEHPR